jgi:hypothetical protein
MRSHVSGVDRAALQWMKDHPGADPEHTFITVVLR